MRDYAKIVPKFWVGKTGKAMRGNVEAQVVALYLMTCPTSEMTGVFHCPVMYIAHETGLGLEGASKGLQSLIDMDFCTFDESSDWVFVHEMAKYQIGEELKVSDNQVKFVKKAYLSMKDEFKSAFFERYHAAFHLPESTQSKAPSKPLASQEQEQKQEQKQEQAQEIPPAKRSDSAQGSRLPDDWALPKAWGDWALEQQPTWTPQHVRLVADKFHDHWIGKSGKDARKADWQATWRNWVRNEKPLMGARASPDKSQAQRNEENRLAKELLFGKKGEVIDV